MKPLTGHTYTISHHEEITPKYKGKKFIVSKITDNTIFFVLTEGSETLSMSINEWDKYTIPEKSYGESRLEFKFINAG